MKIVLGSMTFSDQADETASLEMLRRFCGQGGEEVDTAYQYNGGDTERLLGKLLSAHPELVLKIATKVNPWDGNGLKPGEVQKQFAESRERLRTGSVDLLYLHSPDLDTPVADTLAVCWDFYRQGAFRRFGLSNFASWQVAEVVEICRSKGWMVPVVYQGMYNALTRDVERELFPCLRNYGIRFYAYNPLAGGLLTGKHGNYAETPEPGRFTLNDQYPARYWKPEYFRVLKSLTAVCKEHGITPAGAALRWLVHHSRLSVETNDAVILGASRLAHLKENLAACAHGGLPRDIVNVLDEGWETVRADCFRYFRP
ncbi:MAG: aldo/keto reductase [Gammaproteobacteria bacterium]|nr:aldo/keto reductase [Gammaproteobacteria bacterium]